MQLKKQKKQEEWLNSYKIEPVYEAIIFDDEGNAIDVNSKLISVCKVYDTLPQSKENCITDASTLDGTGYGILCGDIFNPYDGEPNGASTGWLRTSVPVNPGEKITLTFYIYDKGDGILDSAVLIDNFRWSAKKVLNISTDLIP